MRDPLLCSAVQRPEHTRGWEDGLSTRAFWVGSEQRHAGFLGEPSVAALHSTRAGKRGAGTAVSLPAVVTLLLTSAAADTNNVLHDGLSALFIWVEKLGGEPAPALRSS